jgi:hypothetical protein
VGVEEKMDQIAGIFTRNEVPFAQAQDGSGYRVLYESTAVFVSVRPFQDGTVVHFDAPLVVDFDLSQNAGTAFSAINHLNREVYFAKFVLHEEESGRGTITAETDLLGDDLQSSELMNGLQVVAQLADSNDERLQADIGGKTYAEVLQAEENQSLET